MDELYLEVLQPTGSSTISGSAAQEFNSRTLFGWTSIRVTRGVERIPPDFSISMTEVFPGQIEKLVVQPGDHCHIQIGANQDLVLTGYVDDVVTSVDRGTHSITVNGRGLSQDLVDCSVDWAGGQVSGSNALAVANTLANPYNVKVVTDVDVGAPIPQKNIAFDETVFDVIQQICKYEGLLAYELENGNLILTRIGNFSMASNLQEGMNIQSATASRSMSQCFSEYRAYQISIDTMTDAGDGGNLLSTVLDPSTPRHRVKALVAETVGGIVSADLVKQRILWELNRRNGRSRSVTIVTDSWRDGAGNLWKPNALVDVIVPALKVSSIAEGEKWVISEVTFMRDGTSGTSARLTIMPQAALSPQPKLWLASPPDVPSLGVPQK